MKISIFIIIINIEIYINNNFKSSLKKLQLTIIFTGSIKVSKLKSNIAFKIKHRSCPGGRWPGGVMLNTMGYDLENVGVSENTFHEEIRESFTDFCENIIIIIIIDFAN